MSSESNYENPETEIDGIRFSFNPLMAAKARNMLLQLVNKLGPVFGKGIEKLKNAEGVLDKEISLKLLPVLSESFGTMIIEFSTVVSPGFYDNLVDAFLARVHMHDGDKAILLKKEKRDALFSRKLLLEAKLLVWCLEEQYEDFFALWKSEAMKNITQVLAKGKSSDFPKPSTGGSTE